MNGTDKKPGSNQPDAVEELFAHATARERPPPAFERAARQTLHKQWQQQTRSRKRKKRFVLFATAASVLLVLTIAWWQKPLQSTLPVMDVALLRSVEGNVKTPREQSGLLQPGAVLRSGQQLTTAFASTAAITWSNGADLRIDQNSTIRLLSPTRIELVMGSVYVDTQPVTTSGVEIVLETPAGEVRHIGTRFLTSVVLGRTSVAVREGRVRFDASDELLRSGERVAVDAAGVVRRESISIHGERWAWADALADPFHTDGKSVYELLEWAADQSGHALQFRSLEAETLATKTRLSGAMSLRPAQAAEMISATTDLQIDILDGDLIVALR